VKIESDATLTDLDYSFDPNDRVNGRITVEGFGFRVVHLAIPFAEASALAKEFSSMKRPTFRMTLELVDAAADGPTVDASSRVIE